MSVKIASFYAELKAQDSLNPSLKQAKTGLGDMKMALGAAGLAAGILTGAFAAAKAVVSATVDPFVELANVTRTLGQVNGETAESNSRLIQMLDDYKVEGEDVLLGQKKLATQQKTLNLPTLLEMADAYQKLSTGAERQQYLTDNLGRSGLVYAEVLSQDKKAIQAKYNAVESGLILDQKQLDLARKYEQQQDASNDAILAAKVALGEIFTPALIAFNKQLAAAVSGWAEFFKFFDLLGKKKNAEEIQRYTLALEDAHKRGDQLIIDLREGRIGAAEFQTQMANVQGEITANNEALGKLRPALDDANTGLANNAAAAGLDEEALKKLQEQIDAVSQAVEDETSWEQMYTNAKDSAERTDATFDLMGQMVKGLGYEGEMVWAGFLESTGKISEPALRQFVNIQNAFRQVKTMLDAGISVNVVVAYLQQQIGAMTGNNEPGGGMPAGGDWEYKGTKNGPGTGGAWYSKTQGWHFGPPGGNDMTWKTGTPGWMEVPPGHPNDDFSVGLTSGEKYFVQPAAAPSPAQPSQGDTFIINSLDPAIIMNYIQMNQEINRLNL